MQPASPAVGSVIAAIKTAISNTPSNFFADVIEAVRPGMARWLSDEAKMAEFDLAQKVSAAAVGCYSLLTLQLDDLYVALLESLTGAIAAGALAATSEILDRYIDIFAPRLSLAVSAEVPRAFQAFWASSFANVVRAEDLSEDVVAFLQEVVDAVPGMIVVNGLAVQASVSQVRDRFKVSDHELTVVGGEPGQVPRGTKPCKPDGTGGRCAYPGSSRTGRCFGPRAA